MLKLSYPIILAILLSFGCSNSNKTNDSRTYNRISGEAQGTTYNLIIADQFDRVKKVSIDSVFNRIDNSLSVWIENSIISKFNKTDTSQIDDPHFLNVFFRGDEIKKMTDGAFDMQIAPLVNAWGFGKNKATEGLTLNIDSLLELVSKPFQMDFDSSNKKIFIYKDVEQGIDVNGIAQGYTVDILSQFIESKGIENYLVEVGGEVRARGTNEQNEKWKVGIDKPISNLEDREIETVALLGSRSLATSGSYRKFYELDGKKYSHTIDPSNGKPVDHTLLSASVMASNCTNADAFATAFMVMGVDKSIDFVAKHPELNLDLFLIYSSDEGDFQTYSTEGFPLKRID